MNAEVGVRHLTVPQRRSVVVEIERITEHNV